jgi:S1-C subfamily serine protease
MSAISDFSNELAVAVARAAEGTVLVDGRRRFPASGIAFAKDLVLTADHVLRRETDISVRGQDGEPRAASIVGRDSASDIAVLRVPDRALSPASVASGPPSVGQLVLAVGRPSDSGAQASWGIVTSIGGPTRTRHGGLLEQYFHSETTPYPGFSGGPLVNTDGEVLGLNTSGLTPGSSITIAAEAAWRIADSLVKDGAVRRGYLGIRTQAVESPQGEAAEVGARHRRGLLVLWLEDGGPAASAGLLVGDIVIGIGEQSVEDPDDIFVALGTGTVGKSVSVSVLRGGKPLTMPVKVGERP